MKNYISAIALSGLLLAACGDGNEKKEVDNDIAEVETVNNNMDAARMNSIEDSTSLLAMTREHEELQAFNNAFERSDLDETSFADGDYTLFVPSDEAFEALPENTVNALNDEANADNLRKVLSFHVVPGIYTLTDLEEAIRNNNGSYTLSTKEGSEITFTEEKGKIVLSDENQNKAYFEKSDMKADNGYIHVIDAVLLPTSS